jgi:CheY-like chemotaxis protein
VHSLPGVGSVFELNLQRSEPAEADAAGPSPGAPLPPALVAPGRQLLYIEDNELNLLIVSEVVRQRPGLQFLSADTGAQGLALARAHRPALILLDMQLPDIDGREVLQQLRADASTAGIRCIALSANAMPEDIRSARAAGFDDYWTKPLDIRAFQQALDGLFGPA